MAADIPPVSRISNVQTIALEKDNSDTELSSSSKKQKVMNNVDYCDFSAKDKKSSDSKDLNPIEQILHQAKTLTDDQDSDEDEQKKKIIAAKKLLFPGALATSFPEVVDTLRNERRQEFCPIYQDETPEAIAQRQAGRKPIGSLLAKRIRWDDLKRKREENQRQARAPIRYGPYGPIYPDSQPTYQQNRTNTSNQSQPSFANPYEQYYTAAQHQYEQMAQMNRVQQEYGGFWPEYSQHSSPQNHYQPPPPLPNSINQQPIQPYTYPYPSMYFNPPPPNIPPSYTPTDYHAYLRQPPPPPPSEPYPY